MKIAIVGGASSAKYAPFDDESWEIWVLGNQMQRYEGKRVNLIFEVHENLDEHDPKYPQWLVDKNIPLVVSQKFPIDCDHSVVFDYQNSPIGENFSSSPAVMMSHAVRQNPECIGIWGIDMALDEHEYFMQRPAMEQWIGYARGRGIDVHIHESSPLGYTAYREGRDWPDKAFDGYDAGEFSKMAEKHISIMKEVEAELSGLMAAQQRIDELKAKYQGHDGARQVYERLEKLYRAKSCGFDVKLEAISG